MADERLHGVHVGSVVGAELDPIDREVALDGPDLHPERPDARLEPVELGQVRPRVPHDDLLDAALRGERQVVGGRSHEHPAHGPVPQHVGLAAQPGAVDLPGEALAPPLLVRAGGGRRRRVDPAERDEPVDVVGSAGLGPATDRGPLPPAERLAADDGPGRVPVDVGVADLDALEPALDLRLVEAVQAAGEAVGDGVLQRRRRGRGRRPASRRAPARSTRCGGTTSPAARRCARPATTAPRRRAGAARPATTRRRRASSARGRSGPLGAAISGPIIVARSVAGPTRRLRTASARRRRNGGSSYSGASTIARLAAEHFWPAWPNAERTRSRRARSTSAVWADDEGVLAARLGEQAQVGTPAEEQPGGVVRAGEHDGVDVADG